MVIIKLIINADDFGYSPGVNYGIIEAYRNGVVKSTTLMVNMNYVDHALKLSEENKYLGIGLHFVLTAGKPLTDARSLVDEKGNFRKGLEYLENYAKIEDVEIELRAQLKKFKEIKGRPSHIDTHHHVHKVKKVYEIVKKNALEERVPIRTFEQDEKVLSTDGFYGGFYKDGVDTDALINILENAKRDGYSTFEVMCHPGFIDYELPKKTSYCDKRTYEIEVLKDNKLKKYIRDNNIDLINFKEI